MCGLTTSPFSLIRWPPWSVIWPPALDISQKRSVHRCAVWQPAPSLRCCCLLGFLPSSYSLLVGQALRALASRSYVWLRCQTRTKLRPVHFESHCRLRSYEVLKRFLPYSFAATFQKVTQVARSAQLRTKIHYVSVSSVVTTTSLSTPLLVHGDVSRFHSVTSAAV